MPSCSCDSALGREADPHYGMIEVFNGESYVWITPQEGVALNDLDKEEFITDPNGNLHPHRARV